MRRIILSLLLALIGSLLAALPASATSHYDSSDGFKRLEHDAQRVTTIVFSDRVNCQRTITGPYKRGNRCKTRYYHPIAEAVAEWDKSPYYDVRYTRKSCSSIAIKYCVPIYRGNDAHGRNIRVAGLYYSGRNKERGGTIYVYEWHHPGYLSRQRIACHEMGHALGMYHHPNHPYGCTATRSTVTEDYQEWWKPSQYEYDLIAWFNSPEYKSPFPPY